MHDRGEFGRQIIGEAFRGISRFAAITTLRPLGIQTPIDEPANIGRLDPAACLPFFARYDPRTPIERGQSRELGTNYDQSATIVRLTQKETNEKSLIFGRNRKHGAAPTVVSNWHNPPDEQPIGNG
jgi:hypothetical protein